jgi:hypothetical protein
MAIELLGMANLAQQVLHTLYTILAIRYSLLHVAHLCIGLFVYFALLFHMVTGKCSRAYHLSPLTQNKYRARRPHIFRAICVSDFHMYRIPAYHILPEYILYTYILHTLIHVSGYYFANVI